MRSSTLFLFHKLTWKRLHFPQFSSKFFCCCWNVFLGQGEHMMSSCPLVKMWDYFHCQGDYLWIYKYCIFCFSHPKHWRLIWYESMMTNTKFHVSFSKNYGSNYAAHRTSQFSITWEYQKTEFGKRDLSSSTDTNRSSLNKALQNISFLWIQLLIQN